MASTAAAISSGEKNLIIEGEHFFEKGEYEQALKLFQAVLENNPNSTSALNDAALTLAELGDPVSAVTYFEHILSLEPSHENGFFNLLDLLIEAEEPGLALEAFRKYEDGIPNGPEKLKYVSSLVSIVKAELATTPSLDEKKLAYYDVLAQIHRSMRPTTYLEVGVQSGRSIALASAETICVGVDPDLSQIQVSLGDHVKLFEVTSDDFFEQASPRDELGGKPIDLAFIDGMHRFEFALRDFINVERHSARDSVVLIHDCLPVDVLTSSREQKTGFWSGDIWKVIACLKKYRPDLTIHTLDASPTGLGFITNLDPTSTVLSDDLESICAEFADLSFSRIAPDRWDELNCVTYRPAIVDRLVSMAQSVAFESEAADPVLEVLHEAEQKISAGEHRPAMRLLESLIRISYLNSRVLHRAGLAAWLLKEHEKSERYFRRALETPDLASAETAEGLVELLVEQDRYEEAAALVRSHRELLVSARKWIRYKRLADSYPDTQTVSPQSEASADRSFVQDRVSIVIATLSIEYLPECISSIECNTTYPNYEIIIVNDGSVDEAFLDYLSKSPHRVLHLPAQVGFARANNAGFRVATGEYVMTLNADTVVHCNWLEELVTALNLDPTIAAAGPTVLDMGTETIQSSGSAWDDGDFRKFTPMYRGLPFGDCEHVRRPYLVDGLSGVCVLFKRAPLFEAGLFDSQFVNGWEDMDLAMSLRSHGHQLCHAPAVIEHKGSFIRGTFDIGYYRELVKKNRERFLGKWEGCRIQRNQLVGAQSNGSAGQPQTNRPENQEVWWLASAEVRRIRQQWGLNDLSFSWPYAETNKTLTVVVVCSSNGRNLRPIIESLLAQTSDDWELIVMHDAYNAETERIVRAYAEDRSNIFFAYTGEHYNDGGDSLQRMGTLAAKGKFLLLSDDRTFYGRDAVKALLSGTKIPTAGIVYGELACSRRDAESRSEPRPGGFILRADIARADGVLDGSGGVSVEAIRSVFSDRIEYVGVESVLGFRS